MNNNLNRTPSGKLRLGIVGCGAITENAHLPAALTCTELEPVVLCDSNSARLEYLRRQYALADIGVLDYREVFRRVDAVVLALPNHLHAPVGAELLSHGIHVLCEKPLGVTTAECARLCQAARSNAVVLAVGYMTRFYPSIRLAKSLLDGGFLGRVSCFDCEYGTEEGWSTFSGYNLCPSTSGGGVLVSSGSHIMDRICHLFGRVKIVSYADDNHGGVEANCIVSVTAEFGGSRVGGLISLSKTHKFANRLRITGERGALVVEESKAEAVTYLPAEGRLLHEIREAQGSVAPNNYFRLQLEDFVHAIRENIEPAVNGEEASRSVALVEDCYSRAERLPEPWVHATLDRLKSSLPVQDSLLAKMGNNRSLVHCAAGAVDVS